MTALRRRWPLVAVAAAAATALGTGATALATGATPMSCADARHGAAGASLQVCATAEVTQVVAYRWSLVATARPNSPILDAARTIRLSAGETGEVSFGLAATPSASVTYRVAGTVTVRNRATAPATFTLGATLGLPGATGAGSVDLAAGATLPGLGQGSAPAEATYPYSFTLAGDQPAGTLAAVTAALRYVVGGTAGDVAAHAPRVELGPDAPEVVSGRTMLLQQAFAEVSGGGVTVAPAAAAGPWTVSGGGKPPATAVFAARITNVDLPCSTARRVVSHGVLRPADTSEKPAAGDPDTVTASATVVVVTPPCPQPSAAAGRTARVAAPGVTPPPAWLAPPAGEPGVRLHPGASRTAKRPRLSIPRAVPARTRAHRRRAARATAASIRMPQEMAWWPGRPGLVACAVLAAGRRASAQTGT